MTIYVGTDGSEGAAAALRWAAREGELRNLPVTAVVAWDLLKQRSPDDDTRFDATYDERDALTALDTWLVEAVGTDAAAMVGRIAVNDLPWRALVSTATDGELLVVGARGNGGFLGLRLGSVSEHVLQQARCPVAVVHADGPGHETVTDERIIVGVDGSETASRAVAWALDEARARNASVRLLCAWAVPVMAYPGAVEGAGIFEQASDEILRDAMRDADAHGLAHPIECKAEAGGAAAALVDAARDATLVVVGSRGLSRARELVFGSVSHQVVHHAGCPVVVIPPAGGGET